MKPNFFTAAGRIIWLISTLIIVFVLLYKVSITNDVHATLAQDTLENWIALGVTFILLKQLWELDTRK